MSRDEILSNTLLCRVFYNRFLKQLKELAQLTISSNKISAIAGVHFSEISLSSYDNLGKKRKCYKFGDQF